MREYVGKSISYHTKPYTLVSRLRELFDGQTNHIVHVSEALWRS